MAIKEGPKKQQRRSRRGRVLALAALGAVGFVAAYEPARERVLGLVGGGGPEPEPAGQA